MSPDVLELFLELAAIPSPPGQERAVADVVTRYLRDLALPVEEDDAAAAIDGSAGNLIARVEPTGANGGGAIFLCAHLDTVPPLGPIEPVVEDGVVRNAGGTILGADNKAAVAVMLEAVRRLLAEGRPHAGVELLFTPKEEVGLLGANALAQDRLVSRFGFVFDVAGPIGDVVLGAPTQRALSVRFHGRAAHAGMAPEEGRSAVAAAARAIADLRLGRLDDETTANVGVITGGSARNVVPEWCSFEAEARAHDERRLTELVQEMIDTITWAAGVAECEVETQLEETYRGYRFKRDAPVVRLANAALERCGIAPNFVLTGGAADANVFNERGVPCLNLANGMAEVHTRDEHIHVEDLERMVDVTLALIEEARHSDHA